MRLNNHRILAFVGGIHGVGKTTLASKLCNELNLKHLSAGELIREAQSDRPKAGKAVSDIPSNQELLLSGLAKRGGSSDRIVLDGHFCVFDQHYCPAIIPIEVFRALGPENLIVITDEPSEIYQRQKMRDGNAIPLEALAALQTAELAHAQLVANTIGVPLSTIPLTDSLSIRAAFSGLRP